MKERISKTELSAMFAEAARIIREQKDLLSELDCVAGDGDHGTTMLRVADQMEAAISTENQQSLRELFKSVGWKVLGVDGGASSALLGTFFGGMGDAEIGNEIDCSDLAGALEAGLRAMSKQTKAQPGDKTMMDALVPGVNAIRAAVSAGKTIPWALEEAASAAGLGAESTKDLVAKYGRAKLQGEKTRGYPDAGAVSVALLFKGFSVAFAAQRES
jgi:phosphoenolpyruvate---glycerone phosphotransferase subunit DhaL